ncbi:MAG: hypothetical protein ACW98Y_09055 [Candidatus Thorarchaeota archaeon]|jgi:hypothetical protein
MARSYSRIGITLFTALFVALFISGAASMAQAQSFGADWIEDDNLHILLLFDGRSAASATTEANAITIPRETPMELYLEINVTNAAPLNMSGVITFYYQGIAVLPIEIQNPITGTAWVPVDPAIGVLPVTYQFNLSDYLSLGDIDLMTGIYEASLKFNYYEMDPVTLANTGELQIIEEKFFFRLEVTDPLDAVFTVAGAITAVSSVTAVSGLGFNFKSIFEAIQTAHKARSIQKKTGEIRSLPNLLVIGATAALFSMLAGMVKVKKKKPKKGEPEVTEEEADAVSEYRLRQRIRETAPPAWRVDRCPKCKRNWHKKTNTCKKCKIGEEEGRNEYAEYLSTKTEKAIKVVGKKKSISIQKLAKAIKSNEYNAGVIGAAMVDTEVTEIQKIETPFKSFVMNIGGLVFLVLTWQQLLGGATSQYQTTLTIIGAGMSLAVIVALYIARKTQIEKLHAEVDAGGKMMPTEEEVEAAETDDEPEDDVPPSQDVADEETPMYEVEEPDEEVVEIEEEPYGEVEEELPEESEEDVDDSDPDAYSDEDSPESDSESLTEEELDKERM